MVVRHHCRYHQTLYLVELNSFVTSHCMNAASCRTLSYDLSMWKDKTQRHFTLFLGHVSKLYHFSHWVAGHALAWPDIPCIVPTLCH